MLIEEAHIYNCKPLLLFSLLGPNLSATELIPLLCQAGLFDRAFSVAIAFKVGLTGIFESVAAKYVSFS